MAVHTRRTAGSGLRPLLLEIYYRIDKIQVIISCQCVSAFVQLAMVPTLSHYTSQPVAPISVDKMIFCFLSPNKATTLQKHFVLQPFLPQAMHDKSIY